MPKGDVTREDVINTSSNHLSRNRKKCKKIFLKQIDGLMQETDNNKKVFIG